MSRYFIDFLQNVDLQSYSFLGPHDWLHHSLGKKPFSSSSVISFDQLLNHLDDIKETLSDADNSHRLVISFRLWERGDADMEHLMLRLKSAVQHAVFDLLTEYFLLTQSACTIETPVLKARSLSSSIQTAVETKQATTNQHGCTNASVIANHLVASNSVHMSSHIMNTILPWLDIARGIQTPLVTFKTFSLFSDLGVNLLVCELLSQLNLLVEVTNKPFIVSTHLAKCPILQLMTSASTSSSPKANESAQSHRSGFHLNRSFSSSPQPTCACLRNINFFAFQQDHEHGEKWVQFSSSAPSPSTESNRPGQRKEFVLVGRNYSICRYQAAFDKLSCDLRQNSDDSDSTESSCPPMMFSPVKPSKFAFHLP